jgi:hypothetical protein
VEVRSKADKNNALAPLRDTIVGRIQQIDQNTILRLFVFIGGMVLLESPEMIFPVFVRKPLHRWMVKL